MLWRTPLSVSSFLRKPVLQCPSVLRCSFSFSSIRRTSQATDLGFEEYKPKYQRSFLEEVEDVENYGPGGFHPISIGGFLGNGRYQIIHKLGFGGSSTVWLARDKLSKADSSSQGRLVTLKVLASDCSSRLFEEIPEIYVPSKLDKILGPDHPLRKNIQRTEDHFMEDGPNGSHLCLVTPFAGPSMFTVSECLAIKSNNTLRADLTRKLAKQLTSVIECMHSGGIIHGDISTSNILFSLADHVHAWGNNEVYAMLEQPETQEVQTCDGSPPGPSAPRYLVDTAKLSHLVHSYLLQENVMLTDFGQSFEVAKKPRDYIPGTVLHCAPPEVHFGSTIDFGSDVWMLACTIFEIRTGHSLFDSFLGSEDVVWKQAVEMLGKLPEPWWESFEGRESWFEENGEPRPKDVQKSEGLLLTSSRSSIRQKLREIGDREGPPQSGADSLSEEKGAQMAEEEVGFLGDLLEKMLRYQPSERITIQEVARHPWFSYDV